MVHKTDADNPELKPANTEEYYQISEADLPLSCPQPNMQIWDSHPRVFLPLDDNGQAECPYCGAHYSLQP